MAAMAGTDPGERSAPGEAPPRRVLDRAPSERYTGGAPAGTPPGRGNASDGGSSRSALTGPLLRAVVLAALGSASLVLISTVLASTVGLLFISAGMGAAVGLVLARAAVPASGERPLARRPVGWLAVALTLAAIVAAFVATWIYARSQGGVLELLDYLFTTFGLFVPGQLVIGSVAAAWGANAGPVQR